MHPNARHTSVTIEMIDLNAPVDVAVIDEIQMISDVDRGWAWTQALLGVNAKEVHLCGDDTALSAIAKIVELCGDECMSFRNVSYLCVYVGPRIIIAKRRIFFVDTNIHLYIYIWHLPHIDRARSTFINYFYGIYCPILTPD